MPFPQIKKFLREETNYPNKKVVIVEKLGIENNKFKTYEASIGKEEAALVKFIKFNLIRLTQKDRDKLWDLIENFGDEKYTDGTDDCEMSNAGAEL